MDFDHREKGRTGAGRITDTQRQLQMRDRLFKLAMETSDVSKVSVIEMADELESLLTPKSPRTFRMQTLLNSSQHRSKLFGSHPGKTSSGKPGTKKLV